MKRSERRLSRPLYEALPWIYILCGLVALAVSYLQTSSGLSALYGIPGFFAFLGGIVLLLRRRDYRRMRERYQHPDALSEHTGNDQKQV